MSVKMTGRYLGNKNTEITHGPSGAVIKTTPPKDNQGDGTSFSPTDLAAASLGTCTVAVMSIIAERDGIDLSGLHFSVEKHMQASPRRIAKLVVDIHLPKHLNALQREKLERAASHCPVHRSLHPEVEQLITFHYDV